MQQTLQLDDVPFNRFHFKITGLTFGAHLTDGYVLGVIGFALAQLTPQMGLTPFWQGMIGSSALIGLFLGSLVLGWLADIVGRQRIFTLSFIIITLASLMQFWAESASQLFLLRVLVGIGLGGDFSVGHTLLAEFAPRRHRGVMLGAFSVLWTVGYVAGSFAGHYATMASPEAWRWLLASAAVPAFIILIMRFGTPESPRWLMRKGRREEALAIVKRYFGDHVMLQPEPCNSESRNLAVLFSPLYRRRTAFNCLFFVCLVLPYFAIYTFLPTILTAMGLGSDFGTDLLLSGLLFVGAVLGIGLTIACSRRGFLIGAFIFLALCLVAMSLPGQQHSGWLIACFAAFTLIMSAVSNLVGVFPAESFPTEVRSMGVGLAISVSRLGSAVGTLLLPVVIGDYGVPTTMGLLAAILLLGALVSILWAPETKGLTLVDAAQDSKSATAKGVQQPSSLI
ncbi:MFS transporter [Pantoea sp. 1.19]|uniref:MFS transporter n=1 Tax=Pantoea sp. 1.19 TaxID=1925589 RepID=UPI000948FF96|nr:MFS transporter [Pantoea sp. 1.19]